MSTTSIFPVKQLDETPHTFKNQKNKYHIDKYHKHMICILSLQI